MEKIKVGVGEVGIAGSLVPLGAIFYPKYSAWNWGNERI